MDSTAKHPFSRRIAVTVYKDGQRVMSKAFTQGPVVMGRQPNCDLVLEYSFISRTHCQIVEQNGEFYLVDLNSRNGVLVEGHIVHRAPIGDALNFAIEGLNFEVRCMASADASTTQTVGGKSATSSRQTASIPNGKAQIPGASPRKESPAESIPSSAARAGSASASKTKRKTTSTPPANFSAPEPDEMAGEAPTGLLQRLFPDMDASSAAQPVMLSIVLIFVYAVIYLFMNHGSSNSAGQTPMSSTAPDGPTFEAQGTPIPIPPLPVAPPPPPPPPMPVAQPAPVALPAPPPAPVTAPAPTPRPVVRSQPTPKPAPKVVAPKVTSKPKQKPTPAPTPKPVVRATPKPAPPPAPKKKEPAKAAAPKKSKASSALSALPSAPPPMAPLVVPPRNNSPTAPQASSPALMPAPVPEIETIIPAEAERVMPRPTKIAPAPHGSQKSFVSVPETEPRTPSSSGPVRIELKRAPANKKKSKKRHPTSADPEALESGEDDGGSSPVGDPDSLE